MPHRTPDPAPPAHTQDRTYKIVAGATLAPVLLGTGIWLAVHNPRTDLDAALITLGVAVVAAVAFLLAEHRKHPQPTTAPRSPATARRAAGRAHAICPPAYPDASTLAFERGKVNFEEVLAASRKLTTDQIKALNEIIEDSDILTDIGNARISLAIAGRASATDRGPGSLGWCLDGLEKISEGALAAGLAVLARDLLTPAEFNRLTAPWARIGQTIPKRPAVSHYTVEMELLMKCTDGGKWTSLGTSTVEAVTAAPAIDVLHRLVEFYLQRTLLTKATWRLRAWEGADADTTAPPAASLSHRPVKPTTRYAIARSSHRPLT